ncbi:MAG TPA: PQQ-binding-like beta-propeller repeat protein [Solirubrobacteraceae bacterium]|nr:PQQ-binding-like beta-propeller repeat protein [Solirubrobacteraceae bacterium]
MSPSRSRQVRRAESRRKQSRDAGKPSEKDGPPRLPALSKKAWRVVAALLVVLVAGVVILLFSSSSSTEHLQLTGSGYPNVDTSNTRHVGGPIDSSTVSKLGVAWSNALTAKSQYGSYSSSPVITKGVIFSQDLASNVQAISLKTGRVLWSKSYEDPDQGPNGIAVAEGRVYGATQSFAFALDERTGTQLWSARLVRNEHEGIDMAPGVHAGIVYVSTVPGTVAKYYGGEGQGILWALDARTGKRLWHFDTAPKDLWSAKNVSINSGGGLWYTPAFDGRGSMYIGTANPAPFPGTEDFPWGASRPGPNLYTDSLVKLNAKTGKLEWYYQQTPHDVYDWDLQDPPILMTVGGRREVIGAGKGGVVVALDTATGKPLWKRPVGIHNGHDKDNLYAMRGELSRLKLPVTVYPGQLGGVIAPMASNGSTVFVPVVNHSATMQTQTEIQENGPTTGELVALDAATGAIKWDQKLPGPAFGAVTVVNDLVFATTFEGSVYAFAAATGNLVWQKQLPAGANTGVAVSGDTVIAPAGIATAEGQTPKLVAYRLGAGG